MRHHTGLVCTLASQQVQDPAQAGACMVGIERCVTSSEAASLGMPAAGAMRWMSLCTSSGCCTGQRERMMRQQMRVPSATLSALAAGTAGGLAGPGEASMRKLARWVMVQNQARPQQ